MDYQEIAESVIYACTKSGKSYKAELMDTLKTFGYSVDEYFAPCWAEIQKLIK
jgi:hypothetical protein